MLALHPQPAPPPHLGLLQTWAARQVLVVNDGRPGADTALTDLLVLLPWITVGAIVIDGYHIPQIQRSLGLL